MPYTDDPLNILSDRVRFLVGDTKVPLDLTDSEVAYLLESERNNPLRAAARGAGLLASRFAAAVEDKRVGPLRIRTVNKAKQYAALAAQLWARVLSTGGTPFAGGISAIDKSDRRNDLDRVKPAFSRRMLSYPPGVADNSSLEERRGGDILE